MARVLGSLLYLRGDVLDWGNEADYYEPALGKVAPRAAVPVAAAPVAAPARPGVRPPRSCSVRASRLRSGGFRPGDPVVEDRRVLQPPDRRARDGHAGPGLRRRACATPTAPPSSTARPPAASPTPTPPTSRTSSCRPGSSRFQGTLRGVANVLALLITAALVSPLIAPHLPTVNLAAVNALFLRGARGAYGGQPSPRQRRGLDAAATSASGRRRPCTGCVCGQRWQPTGGGPRRPCATPRPCCRP